MAYTFTPTCPGTGPWYIDREDCIGDSLLYINANTGYLDCKISSLSSTKLDKTGGTVTGNILTPNRPMFSVGQPRGVTTPASIYYPGNEQYVAGLTNILTDTTGGYNTSTKVYTASVTGFYWLYFCTSIYATTNDMGDITFRKTDGTFLTDNLVLRSTTTWTAGSLACVALLNAGESVGPYIQAWTGAGSNARGTQFSGYLIG